MWNGLPIYRRLLSQGTEGARSSDSGPDYYCGHRHAVSLIGVRFRVRPQLRFRRNVFPGHALSFIGETSMFLSVH